MNENGKILAALLGGAALGAVLGVLFAPDSGSNLRGKMVDSSRGFTDSLRDRVGSVKDVITDLGEKIMGNAENELADLTSGSGNSRSGSMGSSLDNTGSTSGRGSKGSNSSNNNNYNL